METPLLILARVEFILLLIGLEGLGEMTFGILKMLAGIGVCLRI